MFRAVFFTEFSIKLRAARALLETLHLSENVPAFKQIARPILVGRFGHATSK